MQTAVQVDFHGMQPVPTLRPTIQRHLAALEQRFGDISVCRVVLKRPGNGQRNSEPYEVSIRAALHDGREIHVAHAPAVDERYSDLGFALNDAFRRARRLLQDQVGRGLAR
jgi:hypothetical protein